MPIDEQAAVLRLKAGDIGGLETLVRAYQDRAVRCAYLVIQDQALALDVVQASFVKAYEHIGGFDASRPFGPWFLKSVLRDALKAAAARARTTNLEPLIDGENAPLAVADADPGPEQLWEQREMADMVLSALAALPPHERVAVVQRYYLGLSEAEMAEASGSPRGTVKRRLHTARGRLRGLLQPLDPRSEMV